MSQYKVLTDEQVQSFMDKGYLAKTRTGRQLTTAGIMRVQELAA